MLPVRTNNDIEGWQHSLNRRSGNKVHLPFYLLVELLDQESHLVSIQIRLVSDGKLSRIQRKKYWQLQERVFKHWEDFNFKEISLPQWTSWEIRRCANLFTLIKVYIWLSKGQVSIRHSHVPACNKTIRSANLFTLIKVDIWFGWNRVVRIISIFISFCQSISDITRDYWQDNVLGLCSL